MSYPCTKAQRAFGEYRTERHKGERIRATNPGEIVLFVPSPSRSRLHYCDCERHGAEEKRAHAELVSLQKQQFVCAAFDPMLEAATAHRETEMTDKTYENVLIERDGGVTFVILNRP